MNINFDFKPERPCCFCGEKYKNYGNDITPLVSSRGTRCCDKCNVEIVIPNRLKFWKPITYRYFIKNKDTNELIDCYGQPYRPGKTEFIDLVSANEYAIIDSYLKDKQWPNCEIVRIAFVED